jgi:hypothetical protein
MGYFSEDSVPPELNLQINNDVLYITHNAGFFSCTSIALFNIIRYFNNYKALPKAINRSSQYSFYKHNGENLAELYYKINDANIEYSERIEVVIPDDGSSPQFSDYRTICISDIMPFIDRYFQTNDYVINIVKNLESKYNLDYKNLCSVLYRGNDKSKETSLASHEEFLEKCAEVKSNNPNIRFLVQTDETDFLEKFMSVYSDSIYFNEIPHINKCNTAVHNVIDRKTLPEFGAKFLAATICVSKCEHLVTHSGNCGLWAVLYRGNTENVYQYLTDKWL